MQKVWAILHPLQSLDARLVSNFYIPDNPQIRVDGEHTANFVSCGVGEADGSRLSLLHGEHAKASPAPSLPYNAVAHT